ncbi:unnamed protein product [Meloidogyne enterolobii]|uniref:Uncharacterized protein n=1 Tax=Meloidogyne enterolobii TaxID=390850 RepID=A0ACB0Z544_MELEN
MSWGGLGAMLMVGFCGIMQMCASTTNTASTFVDEGLKHLQLQQDKRFCGKYSK